MWCLRMISPIVVGVVSGFCTIGVQRGYADASLVCCCVCYLVGYFDRILSTHLTTMGE
jgi:hypothetical protein